MGSGKEKCSGCGTKLLVSQDAKTIKCTACQTVTQVRPQDPIRQAKGWVKSFMNDVSTKIDALPSSGKNYYQTGSYAPSYSYGYGQIPGNNYYQMGAAAPSYSYGYGQISASGNNFYQTGASAPSHSYGPYGYGSGYNPAPPITRPFAYPSVHGNKRAVLCGVSYRWKRYELKGSINDINCMKFFLVDKMGYPNEAILVLTEDERDPYRVPTKQNIRVALHWLLQGCKSGDSLVFHYSGHGSQKLNFTGDEVDGYDETLCPLDFESQGMIIDDEINETIVRPLPRGAKLHALIDACHSGTVLDLPYLCRMAPNGYYIWENHSPRSGAYKSTSGGLAISISGCDDNQVSADTTALSGGVMTGAMTYSFIQAAQSASGLTYGSLLNAMRNAIRQANSGVRMSGPILSFLTKVLFTGLSQEPQLSSSEMFDIYRKPFSM